MQRKPERAREDLKGNAQPLSGQWSSSYQVSGKPFISERKPTDTAFQKGKARWIIENIATIATRSLILQSLESAGEPEEAELDRKKKTIMIFLKNSQIYNKDQHKRNYSRLNKNWLDQE